MKSKLLVTCTLLGLGFALPVANAANTAWRVIAQGPRPAAVGVEGHPITRSGQPLEKEIVTFLGVETAPVSETLGSQLGLAKDSGLVVINVIPDSPAANALKQHDVLVKFDDQLLVEPRQFSVLVRNHKEGDEVTFTYIRAGKQATAKVKLGKHEVPKVSTMIMGDVFRSNPDAMRGSYEETNRVLNLLQGTPLRETRSTNGPAPQRAIRGEVQGGTGWRAINMNTSNRNMVFSDEAGTLDLTLKDGKKTLVAKNAKGEQVFSGPVNTPEERNALPPDVRDRLDKIEGMQGFTFRTEEGFVPKTQTIRPFPQGIVYPFSGSDAPASESTQRVF